MSVFDKVIAAHDQAIAARQEAHEKALADKASAEEQFKQDFVAKVNEIALPIFEQFAQDAHKHSFPALVDQSSDGYGNPSIAVRIVPVRGAVLPTVNKSEEAVFVLRGVVKDQKVEHVSYFDQRPGRNGNSKVAFGIPSINKDVLERNLEQFLTAALKARQ